MSDDLYRSRKDQVEENYKFIECIFEELILYKTALK